MAKNQDRVDLFFSSRGDYSLGPQGLQDTETDPLRSFYQEVETRTKSSIRDWEMHEKIGASLDDFVGQLNNKTTAESIKLRIISSLTSDGFVPSLDLKVQYVPVDNDRIIFRLSLNVSATAENNNSESLKIQILYNYKENNTFVTH